MRNFSFLGLNELVLNLVSSASFSRGSYQPNIYEDNTDITSESRRSSAESSKFVEQLCLLHL
ncbi:hypothetical protein T01_1015 [Trichinella spiralis]|uniref:Uncharacterized protein n=1 Tax=Trichinella spiralis TaxID=6334 RepID=A0A0V1BFH2_TRISP|nr:hypothetical protein T01_1015 [Trichinella spiralis]